MSTLTLRELPARDVADVAALLRALGGHRYVASRLVLVHAAAYAALDGIHLGDLDVELEDGRAFAREVLENREIDPASRDERLHRRATEREAAAVLEGLWTRPEAREKLAHWLAAMELPIPGPDAEPFDDDVEDEMHPVLIDAGWELLPLRELDETRHKGAIGAFEDRVMFESARFEEEDAVPKTIYLQELSAFGPAEILRGAGENGLLVRAPSLWTAGCDVYQDYVLRGVLRAARLA